MLIILPGVVGRADTSLKTELVADCRFESRAQAATEVHDYIKGFYNSWRLHSTIGFTTPIEYEMAAAL